jgi:hypothetical protein
MPPEVLSAQPRAVVLGNGALLLTAGRPGVDLFVSHDGFGKSWKRYSLPTYHNQLVETQKEAAGWKFCAAYEQAAANHTYQENCRAGWIQSDGYNAIAAVGHDTALVCYDRMGVSQGPCVTPQQPVLSPYIIVPLCSSHPTCTRLPFVIVLLGPV